MEDIVQIQKVTPWPHAYINNYKNFSPQTSKSVFLISIKEFLNISDVFLFPGKKTKQEEKQCLIRKVKVFP